MPYEQANRILAIDTKLGANKALLSQLDGEDQLSRPFVFRVRFATEESNDAVKALLGTEVTIWFGRPGEASDGPIGIERRPLHGHVRRLTLGESARADMTEWRAEVVPKLWFLSRTTDCRIFQDKTIPDIIQDVLELHGVGSFQIKKTRSYEKLEYCVQYRETALDFITRLMEQAGLFYWHEHEAGAHKLVIADENGSTFAADFPEVPIMGNRESALIRQLEDDFSVGAGKWALRDFNFKTPSLRLDADAPMKAMRQPDGDLERFDYPGLYENAGQGRDVADLRMQEEEAHYHRRHGESGVAGLNSGTRFKIADVTDPEVVVTEVRHRARDHSHWTPEMWGEREPERPFYDNSFVCIPKRVPYRQDRATVKPFVRGPQTAIVTGGAGDEICTDEYGRVKVKFHWDRVNPDDDTSSCWIRVSQGWAGKSWGQIHIPRVGHEVIVDFLEGDPDRPIITGRVYNAENMPPYGLPANKTQSGIKSNSSKGGSGSNEFRFEDMKGTEQIYLHAQFNLDGVVENNETRHVKVDRTTDIDANETSTIGANKTTTVKGNFDEKVLGTETRQVVGNVTETFLANETRTITGSMTETVTGSVTQTIAGSYAQTVVGGITITTPAAITITAMGGFNLVAPAGTRTVDSFFDKTGGFTADAFGAKLSIVGSKTDIVAGLALSIVANKVDLVRSKIDISGTVFKNKPTEITSGATAIAQVVSNLHVVGLFVVV